MAELVLGSGKSFRTLPRKGKLAESITKWRMNKAYLNYLKSKDWSDKRARRLNATDGKCDICGTQSFSNDVHHVKYAANLQDVELWDLKVLCRRCHRSVHRALDISGRQIKKERSSLKRWSLTLHTLIDEKLLPECVLNKIRKNLGLPCVKISYDPKLSTKECDNYKPKKIPKRKPKRNLPNRRQQLKEKQALKERMRAEIEEANRRLENGERLLL